MGEKLLWAQLVVTLVCGGVALYTASVIQALKVWILTQEAGQRKENDERYVSRAACAMCQVRRQALQGD